MILTLYQEFNYVIQLEGQSFEVTLIQEIYVPHAW